MWLLYLSCIPLASPGRLPSSSSLRLRLPSAHLLQVPTSVEVDNYESDNQQHIQAQEESLSDNEKRRCQMELCELIPHPNKIQRWAYLGSQCILCDVGCCGQHEAVSHPASYRWAHAQTPCPEAFITASFLGCRCNHDSAWMWVAPLPWIYSSSPASWDAQPVDRISACGW